MGNLTFGVTEFLSFFREQQHNKANALAGLADDDTSDGNDEGLLGADAKIPGGMYDSAGLSDDVQAEMV